VTELFNACLCGQVPASGCDPAFGVGGLHNKVAAAGAETTAVPILSVTSFVRSYHSISLAKVDVEGAEVQVQHAQQQQAAAAGAATGSSHRVELQG
jgi:hypothetical protein